MSKKTESESLYRIQSLVLPNLAFGAPEEMYVRLCNDRVHTCMVEQSLRFEDRGRVSMDTFFGALTVDVWRRHCKINDLLFRLAGYGRFRIRFGLHRIGHAQRWLDEQEVDLGGSGEALLDLPFWSRLDGGLLYVELLALGQATLREGGFLTRTAPVKQAKLGIVITHFNRKAQVLPAIERIRSQLLSDTYYTDAIELVVVDNSRNIEVGEAVGATLIPNRNLGGSGGFTRGLLHLMDEGSFSHCLFMDDDASCEVESIRRAHALLQYAITERFAIAGSLLRELEPYRLFEKGAQFDGVVRPLKSGMDMRHINDLLRAEQHERVPDYGAWWFFAFALEDVHHYPFPFFVRGDDILFGLMHRFEIATCNGINCWGDDFGLKSGPLPMYLDVRNHLLQGMVSANKGVSHAIALASKFFLFAVLSYNYATAKAVTLAVRNFAQGPDFWLGNLDTANIRAEIGGFAGEEKMQPLARAAYQIEYASPYEGKLRKLVRIMTLNGILLPSFLLRQGTLFQHKSFRGNFREIFRYKQVIYEYEPLSLGYVARYDRRRFMSELISFAGALLGLMMRFSALRRSYAEALPEMTSQEFWRNVYSSESATPAVTSTSNTSNQGTQK